VPASQPVRRVREPASQASAASKLLCVYIYQSISTGLLFFCASLVRHVWPLRTSLLFAWLSWTHVEHVPHGQRHACPALEHHGEAAAGVSRRGAAHLPQHPSFSCQLSVVTTTHVIDQPPLDPVQVICVGVRLEQQQAARLKQQGARGGGCPAPRRQPPRARSRRRCENSE
jgi:hypothetical protein